LDFITEVDIYFLTSVEDVHVMNYAKEAGVGGVSAVSAKAKEPGTGCQRVVRLVGFRLDFFGEGRSKKVIPDARKVFEDGKRLEWSDDFVLVVKVGFGGWLEKAVEELVRKEDGELI